jgi:hypothetical protein
MSPLDTQFFWIGPFAFSIERGIDELEHRHLPNMQI